MTELTDWRAQIRAPPARGADRGRRRRVRARPAGSRRSAALFFGGAAPAGGVSVRFSLHQRDLAPRTTRSAPSPWGTGEGRRPDPYASNRRDRVPRIALYPALGRARRRGPGHGSRAFEVGPARGAGREHRAGGCVRPPRDPSCAARRRPRVPHRRHDEPQALARACVRAQPRGNADRARGGAACGRRAGRVHVVGRGDRARRASARPRRSSATSGMRPATRSRTSIPSTRPRSRRWRCSSAGCRS